MFNFTTEDPLMDAQRDSYFAELATQDEAVEAIIAAWEAEQELADEFMEEPDSDFPQF